MDSEEGDLLLAFGLAFSPLGEGCGLAIAGATDGVEFAPGAGAGGFGAIGAVSGAAGAVLAPKMLGSPVSNKPAIQAIIIVAKVPTNNAFQPSSEMSFRREGIRAIVPPTNMPTEARCAKPERA